MAGGVDMVGLNGTNDDVRDRLLTLFGRLPNLGGRLWSETFRNSGGQMKAAKSAPELKSLMDDADDDVTHADDDPKPRAGGPGKKGDGGPGPPAPAPAAVAGPKGKKTMKTAAAAVAAGADSDDDDEDDYDENPKEQQQVIINRVIRRWHDYYVVVIFGHFVCNIQGDQLYVSHSLSRKILTFIRFYFFSTNVSFPLFVVTLEGENTTHFFIFK